MKRKWRLLALVLAVMLLCAGCEERRTVDISDGGDLSAVTGETKPAPALPEESAVPETKTEPEPAAETEPEPEPEAEPEEEAAPAEESAEPDAPAGAVSLVSMSLEPGGSGMCLVPLNTGGVFVINNVLSDTCTITTDAKDLLVADCVVEAETGMDAELEFVLLQNDEELFTTRLSASLKEGENSVQVLLRLEGPVSGEYVGKLYINGDFMGGQFTGGDVVSA